MTRILLADDHAIVRRGLREILDDLPGFTVVAEVSRGTDVVGAVLKEKIDLLIMDLNMPGRGGFDVLEELKRLRPNLLVLVFSMHAEQEFASRALAAGASGYLTKDSSLDEIVPALTRILKGGKYVSSGLADALLSRDSRATERAPHELLSNREYEIMGRIAAGQTLKNIGVELSLSAKTVTTYRARILEKLHVKTNAELIQYVISHHLPRSV